MFRRIAMAAALGVAGVTLAAGLAAPAQARVFVGVGIGAPLVYPYPYGYVPPPVYYAPPAYYAPPPVYYTPPAYAPTPGAPPAQSWYWCDNPRGYYPNVQACPGGWRQVAATPAQ